MGELGVSYFWDHCFIPSILSYVIWLAILAMDASSRTSKVRSSVPIASKPFILAGFLAVAYTFKPASWNAMASPAPRLPSEHPVINTVFLDFDIVLCEFRLHTSCSKFSRGVKWSVDFGSTDLGQWENAKKMLGLGSESGGKGKNTCMILIIAIWSEACQQSD